MNILRLDDLTLYLNYQVSSLLLVKALNFLIEKVVANTNKQNNINRFLLFW